MIHGISELDLNDSAFLFIVSIKRGPHPSDSRVLEDRRLLNARASGGTEAFLVTGDPARAAPVITDLLSRALGPANVQNEGEIHRAPPRIECMQT